MKIYRSSDRIPVKIEGVTFWLAPLSYEHRTELLTFASKAQEVKVEADLLQLAKNTVRYSLKAIDGVEQGDGTPFALQFDERGIMSESCFDDLMQLEFLPDLIKVAGAWAMKGVSEISDIPGVVIDFANVKSLKKSDPVPTSPLVH